MRLGKAFNNDKVVGRHQLELHSRQLQFQGSFSWNSVVMPLALLSRPPYSKMPQSITLCCAKHGIQSIEYDVVLQINPGLFAVIGHFQVDAHIMINLVLLYYGSAYVAFDKYTLTYQHSSKSTVSIVWNKFSAFFLAFVSTNSKPAWCWRRAKRHHIRGAHTIVEIECTQSSVSSVGGGTKSEKGSCWNSLSSPHPGVTGRQTVWTLATDNVGAILWTMLWLQLDIFCARHTRNILGWAPPQSR